MLLQVSEPEGFAQDPQLGPRDDFGPHRRLLTLWDDVKSVIPATCPLT
jgi:hypothetical protein